MNIITIGIDLAKHIFAVHGVNENGHAELVKPKVSREQLLPLIANLPPCLIGMEACSGAHHWARLFRQHGHTVKLIAPKFVTPYRMSGKRGKNDAADAAGALDKLEAFASHFGADFYGLSRNSERITLKREGWTVPDTLGMGETKLVPLRAGESIAWKLADTTA